MSVETDMGVCVGGGPFPITFSQLSTGDSFKITGSSGDLDGWDGGEVQERGDICIHIAVPFLVEQKLTQSCKAIILQ